MIGCDVRAKVEETLQHRAQNLKKRLDVPVDGTAALSGLRINA